MRRAIYALVFSAAALAWLPAPAYAEGFVAPWTGVQFGSSASNGRAGFGVAAGGMGAGIIGGEVDWGLSPSFFGTQNDFGHNTLMNLMGNVIVGIPIGGTYGPGFRPYAHGGLGWIRTQIDGGNVFRANTANNQLGWDLGGGAMGFFNDHVGVRGDLSYFRTTTGGGIISNYNFSDLHFWRLSAGLVLR